MAVLELTLLFIPIFVKGDVPENLMKYGCCYFFIHSVLACKLAWEHE